jgi:hypothetical protein
MKRKNIDYDNTPNKKNCYKSFNKRKNNFGEIDNNKKIKTYHQDHEDHEDYNCYDFDMNYNQIYCENYYENISFTNYIK